MKIFSNMRRQIANILLSFCIFLGADVADVLSTLMQQPLGNSFSSLPLGNLCQLLLPSVTSFDFFYFRICFLFSFYSFIYFFSFLLLFPPLFLFQFFLFFLLALSPILSSFTSPSSYSSFSFSTSALSSNCGDHLIHLIFFLFG